MCMQKEHLLESLLFAAAEPLSFTQLTKALSVTNEELKEALEKLRANLTGGIRLLTTDEGAVLVTAPEAAELLESFFSIEGKDIGPAGVEVAALILYEGPCTKAHIDYVRGVNSTSTLRGLMQRGLITRTQHAGQTLYSPTVDLLMHLGIRDKTELPQYETITKSLAHFRAAGDPQKGDTPESIPASL